MATSGVNVSYRIYPNAAEVASYLRAASRTANTNVGSSANHFSSLQVLRYSALAFGVFYGFYHQRSLSAQLKMNEINREYEHKESLIQQAKAEYTKKTMPQESKTDGGEVISDPEDKNFDLEAYLTMKMADAAK